MLCPRTNLYYLRECHVITQPSRPRQMPFTVPLPRCFLPSISPVLAWIHFEGVAFNLQVRKMGQKVSVKWETLTVLRTCSLGCLNPQGAWVRRHLNLCAIFVCVCWDHLSFRLPKWPIVSPVQTIQVLYILNFNLVVSSEWTNHDSKRTINLTTALLERKKRQTDRKTERQGSKKGEFLIL